MRSILNKSVSKRQLSLAYSINPYRGCEFGCKYCYARYTHEFMAPKAVGGGGGVSRRFGLDCVTFAIRCRLSGLIFLKQNAAWLLEQELKKIDPALEIALGTATDPYQPIERRARITRSLLEVFARKAGYRLGIVTKSRLIERDIDLLVEIARRNHAGGARDDYNARCKAGPAAGAARTASGSAFSGGEAAAGGGDRCRDLRFAAAAGNHRQPESARRPGPARLGGGSEFFCGASAVPQAVLTSYLPELRS